MQLSAPTPRKHRVLMSFSYREVWYVVFWNNNRMRTPLPRKARFTTDEALIEFTRRAGGIRMQEDRQILEMMIQHRSSEIPLILTDDQYSKLNR
jgi:hypothetical protein